MIMSLINNTAQVTAKSIAMHDLDSKWPAHNQGKTPGWQAGEKTQYNNYSIWLYNIISTVKTNTKGLAKG